MDSVKYIFALDFAKYVSFFSEEQNTREVVNIYTLYRNKFFVSECILKCVYHCENSRWSEVCCARIVENFLNRLLLLLIFKRSKFQRKSPLLESPFNKVTRIRAQLTLMQIWKRPCISSYKNNTFKISHS